MTTKPSGETTTDTDVEEPRVERNDDEGRYEIWIGDTLAGFTQFASDAHGRLVFPHTEVDPAFSGRGLAGTLVSAAMNDAASREETIVPRCSFVRRYLRGNDVSGLKVVWPGEPGFEP